MVFVVGRDRGMPTFTDGPAVRPYLKPTGPIWRSTCRLDFTPYPADGTVGAALRTASAIVTGTASATAISWSNFIDSVFDTPRYCMVTP